MLLHAHPLANPALVLPYCAVLPPQQANAHHLKFSEINDDRDADEVVLTMEGADTHTHTYITPRLTYHLTHLTP